MASPRGWTARLLALLLAVQAWTIVGLALLLIDPGGVPARLECARRISPTAACLAAQDVVTDVWRMLHFWPLLATIGLGYLAILLVFLRGSGPRAAGPGSGATGRKPRSRTDATRRTGVRQNARPSSTRRVTSRP